MTMKDLYEITGVEFTCTSVDITNHILRFFNHKTTPNLPVIKAVKMSSAYPIAFEPTYWDKNWGKYYIHYENIRREVDLEGCKFTDGGMLANFPIDFIDNQEMRPMYFSHYKDAQTIMYGVGLSECGQTSTTQTLEKDPLSSWEKLKCMGKMNAMKLGLQYLGINSPKTK